MPVGYKNTVGQTLGKVFVYDRLAPSLVYCQICKEVGLERPYPMLPAVYSDTGLICADDRRLFDAGLDCVHFLPGFLAHALKYVGNGTLAHL